MGLLVDDFIVPRGDRLCSCHLWGYFEPKKNFFVHIIYIIQLVIYIAVSRHRGELMFRTYVGSWVVVGLFWLFVYIRNKHLNKLSDRRSAYH